jgi:hypothetical protein
MQSGGMLKGDKQAMQKSISVHPLQFEEHTL